MKVLVIDDSAVSRVSLQRQIEALCHTCAVADNGAAAWDLLQEETFEVIFSDWMMPGLDGFELCRKVRQERSWRHIYFVLVTGYLGQKSDFVEGMQAGADDFLRKPVDPDELRGRLL